MPGVALASVSVGVAASMLVLPLHTCKNLLSACSSPSVSALSQSTVFFLSSLVESYLLPSNKQQRVYTRGIKAPTISMQQRIAVSVASPPPPQKKNAVISELIIAHHFPSLLTRSLFHTSYTPRHTRAHQMVLHRIAGVARIELNCNALQCVVCASAHGCTAFHHNTDTVAGVAEVKINDTIERAARARAANVLSAKPWCQPARKPDGRHPCLKARSFESGCSRRGRF